MSFPDATSPGTTKVMSETFENTKNGWSSSEENQSDDVSQSPVEVIEELLGIFLEDLLRPPLEQPVPSTRIPISMWANLARQPPRTLRERCDCPWRLEALRPLPRLNQLFLVEGSPFDEKAGGTGRKASCDERERIDCEECLVRTVIRVEMRRTVIVEEHSHHDPVEPAELRHSGLHNRDARE